MVRHFLKFIGFFTYFSSKCFGAENGMPQLNPEYWVSQIFWLLLIFGSLYLFLWKMILPKITQNLENRKSKILTDLDDAETSKQLLEKKISTYNKILDEARYEARKIMNKSRKQINENIKLKKNNFDLEIDEEIKKTEKEIKSLKLSSIEHINKIAIETSSEIVEKIVGTKANSSSVSAIVGDISKKRMQKFI